MLRRVPFALSCAALAVALAGATGIGEAAQELVLPRDSVGTPQLRDGAVTGAKVKDRSLLAEDFKRGQLPQGPQGPPGTIEGVTAGGDLAGTYPSPELAVDAVESAQVKDGSLLLADTAVLGGQVRVNPASVAAHACLSLSAPVRGVKPYDRTLVLPTQNLSSGLFVTQMFNTNAPDHILVRVCNVTAQALDAPAGAWAYIVWR